MKTCWKESKSEQRAQGLRKHDLCGNAKRIAFLREKIAVEWSGTWTGGMIWYVKDLGRERLWTFLMPFISRIKINWQFRKEEIKLDNGKSFKLKEQLSCSKCLTDDIFESPENF